MSKLDYALHLLPLDGSAGESVLPCRKELLELFQWELVEWGLARLREQLGQAVVGEVTPSFHDEDDLAIRTVERNRFPGLVIEKELQARVTVGRVGLNYQTR